jgi:hypothetical protein
MIKDYGVSHGRPRNFEPQSHVLNSGCGCAHFCP